MPTVTIPRRVPVQLMREKLGDAKTQQLLTEMFGERLLPFVPLRLRRQTVEETLALLTDEPIPGLAPKRQLVPTIFRAYFAEHAQARGKLITWLKEKREAMVLETEMAQRNGHGVTRPTVKPKPKGRRR